MIKYFIWDTSIGWERICNTNVFVWEMKNTIAYCIYNPNVHSIAVVGQNEGSSFWEKGLDPTIGIIKEEFKVATFIRFSYIDRIEWYLTWQEAL